MTKILFICHGNICRSPMAELIFKDMVKQRGLEDCFEIASAATSTEELGEPIYPPAKRILAEHGLGDSSKRARQITMADYDAYDLLIGMDDWNIRNMLRKWGSDSDGKIHKLMEYSGDARDVADPWYSRDFQTTWDDLIEGCEALLDELISQ